MSKRFADIANMIASENEQLFDRFVNVVLSKNPISKFTLTTVRKYYDDSLVFITPKTGLKPDIKVSGSFHQGDKVTQISVSIKNINSDIDYSTYNYAAITLGYMKSGICQTFTGSIYNIYMAKPNPNGELVFNIASAELADIYEKRKYKFVTTAGPINLDLLLMRIKTQTGIEIHTNIPAEWHAVTFDFNGATIYFDSKLGVVHWLNNILLGIKDMPPIMAKFVAGNIGYHIELLNVFGVSKTIGKPVLKSLSTITTAYMCGSYGTVNCPFYPEISPGELIYIDPKYFKTRVNVSRYSPNTMKELSSVWNVINMEFTFSTRDTNTMLIQMNNINNSRLKDGVKSA